VKSAEATAAKSASTRIRARVKRNAAVVDLVHTTQSEPMRARLVRTEKQEAALCGVFAPCEKRKMQN
jgi:hypothetical protein